MLLWRFKNGLDPGERLMAFLDDIYAVDERPDRTEAVYTAIEQELRFHTGIEVHQGKTQIWNKAGVIPTGSERLTAVARVADPTAIVWRGDLGLPPEEQGVKTLGTPLGHPSFMRSQLATLSAKHEQLISKILHIQDLQCASILLLYCASSRANYTLRVVHPKLSASFAAQHDAALRCSLSKLVSVPPSSMYWVVASLPFTMGGILRSAELTSGAAYWSSWADCLEMIAARNPSIADMIVAQMNHEDAGFHVFGAAQVREQLVRVGFDAPNWHELRAGLRPPGQQVDDRQVGIPGHGWQHEATEAVHAHLLATTISPRLEPEERALIRSQGGPMSGVLFTCLPVSREGRIELSSFRVLVLRRLWASSTPFFPQLPVWPST